MPPRRGSKWPRVIFWVTVAGVVSTSALSLVYYQYTVRLTEQRRAIEQLQSEYAQRVETLRKSGATIDIAVPQTFTTVECNLLVFCTNVVRTTTVHRQVPVAEILDPGHSEGLNRQLDQLKQASASAEKTGATAVTLEETVKILKQLVSPILSVLIALGSLFVILSKHYDAETQKWAFGSLGTILGFWLK